MNLYFCDKRDQMRLIATVSDENEAWKKIDEFCSERGFVIHYVRSWKEPRDGKLMTKYDVGSHTEFFYLEP